MKILDDFVADAKAVPLTDVFSAVGGDLKTMRQRGQEHVGPCPACGKGKDRFSINFGKSVWSCRHYDRRGGDALELIAHKEGLDLKRRSEFLLACSLVQGGRPIPEGGERETEDERAAREKRNAERRTEAEADRERSETDANAYREKAITRGRGIYFNAGDGHGSAADAYLQRRTGSMTIPVTLWENIRFQPAQSYWHGKDARGHDLELHCGPAMIAPLVDLSGRITGCHQTWIDLDRGPKFRPNLRDDKGEPLPTKKMQGAKKGSIIPVLGDLHAVRWVVGEGIETVLAIASAERWLADTFYVAAGDIGNISGPADPSSSFSHPTLKSSDSKGRKKPVRVAGPVPKPNAESECFQLPGHVTELFLGTDGDSELFFTLSAMARAEARLRRANLVIVHLPRLIGGDYSETTSELHHGTALVA